MVKLAIAKLDFWKFPKQLVSISLQSHRPRTCSGFSWQAYIFPTRLRGLSLIQDVAWLSVGQHFYSLIVADLCSTHFHMLTSGLSWRCQFSFSDGLRLSSDCELRDHLACKLDLVFLYISSPANHNIFVEIRSFLE